MPEFSRAKDESTFVLGIRALHDPLAQKSLLSGGLVGTVGIELMDPMMAADILRRLRP
jgi:hypothetical protein